MRWVGHVARMGEERVVYRVLVGKPEGRRPMGRPRRRWVDNIRMNVQGLPVVLYGCETWSLTLREERKLRVSENMVLRRIFGPRMDEVTGGMEEIA